MNILRMELQKFVRKRGSTILAITASIGVIATGVGVAKATIKTVEEINEAANQIDISEERELTKKEKAAIAIPNYISCGILASGTIVCILGGELLNKNTQRNISAAYVALNTAYHNYRSKVVDIYGVKADEEIMRSMATECERPEIELHDGLEWFYDEYSDTMFESSLSVIEDGIHGFNTYLSDIYSVDLNVLYEMWGHPGLPFYQYISRTGLWMSIKPSITRAVDDDGLEYWSIDLNLPSASIASNFNYIWK